MPHPALTRLPLLRLPLPQPDLWLVYKARCGDKNAFGALYDRHAPRVFYLLRRLCDSPETAEDLTQDTFVTAYDALDHWRGVGAFPTWLCGIAVRKYAAARRREERQPRTDLLDEDAPVYKAHDDPLAHCARREAEDALDEAVAHLPPACREAFLLIRVEGLPYQEVADLLGVPLGTVQSRLHRAMRLLHARLSHLIYDTCDTCYEGGSPTSVKRTSHVVR